MFFGSRPISKPRINKLRHGKLTILAAELCALVFTTEEIALGAISSKNVPWDTLHGPFFGRLTSGLPEEDIRDMVVELGQAGEVFVDDRLY